MVDLRLERAISAAVIIAYRSTECRQHDVVTQAPSRTAPRVRQWAPHKDNAYTQWELQVFVALKRRKARFLCLLQQYRRREQRVFRSYVSPSVNISRDAISLHPWNWSQVVNGYCRKGSHGQRSKVGVDLIICLHHWSWSLSHWSCSDQLPIVAEAYISMLCHRRSLVLQKSYMHFCYWSKRRPKRQKVAPQIDTHRPANSIDPDWLGSCKPWIQDNMMANAVLVCGNFGSFYELMRKFGSGCENALKVV